MNLKLNRNVLAALIGFSMIFSSSDSVLAADASSKKAPKKPAAVTSKPIKVETEHGDDVVTGSSTRIDFSETSIDGKMKAPDGFFLQGHNSNSLSQLVKLRSNFRPELRNSSSAVKSHVK